jgi:hypothetical protein
MTTSKSWSIKASEHIRRAQPTGVTRQFFKICLFTQGRPVLTVHLVGNPADLGEQGNVTIRREDERVIAVECVVPLFAVGGIFPWLLPAHRANRRHH